MHDDPTVTSSVPRDVWNSLMRSDQDAVVTQLLAWRDAVFASGRYQDVSLLYEFPSGQQVLLPLARPRWQPTPAAVVASWPPAWGVCGPISQRGRISPAEATAVLADITQRRTLGVHITLRHNADETWLRQARQFRVRRYGYHILDLGGGFEEVWQHKFRGTVRTAVRKAERSGLDIEVDTSGQLLSVFYDLYEKSLRRRSTNYQEPLWLTRRRMTLACPTSPSQLALVAEHFGKDCAVWVARAKGQPAAAVIVLRSGMGAKYWRGAMDKELATPVRANELLHRLAIEEACRDGYRFYDMGGTEPGSPLAAFKEKLGASLHFIHSLHAERLPVYAARRHAKHLVKKAIRLRDY